MTIYLDKATVHITCGGVPLEGDYIPPASNLALLGRHLASRYAAMDAELLYDDAPAPAESKGR